MNEVIPMEELEVLNNDTEGLAWYMARCPKCGVVFNLFTCVHGESYVQCTNGHAL
jgi:hypothetical protein